MATNADILDRLRWLLGPNSVFGNLRGTTEEDWTKAVAASPWGSTPGAPTINPKTAGIGGLLGNPTARAGGIGGIGTTANARSAISSIPGLTLAQIRAMTPAQLAALTPEQLAALTPEDIAAFNQDEYLKGYEGRFEAGQAEATRQYNKAMETLAGITGQNRADIGENYDNAMTQAQQDLVSRGMGGTTLLSTTRSGMEREKAKALTRESDADALRQLGAQATFGPQKLNTLTGLSGDALAALMSRLTGGENLAAETSGGAINAAQSLTGQNIGYDISLTNPVYAALQSIAETGPDTSGWNALMSMLGNNPSGGGATGNNLGSTAVSAGTNFAQMLPFLLMLRNQGTNSTPTAVAPLTGSSYGFPTYDVNYLG